MKKTTTARKQIYSAIYIQEFLRGHRPGEIINAIAEKYGYVPNTIRNWIKPEQLKKQIDSGIYFKIESYKSIFNHE